MLQQHQKKEANTRNVDPYQYNHNVKIYILRVPFIVYRPKTVQTEFFVCANSIDTPFACAIDKQKRYRKTATGAHTNDTLVMHALCGRCYSFDDRKPSI